MRSRLLRAISALAWLVVGTTATAQSGPQPTLPATQLSAGFHLIHAEVASTPAQQQVGLMFRTELAPNAGMLFVFNDKSVHCMWMRNTLIPLSVAFINEQGVIANIEDMAPRTENSHCATRPVIYALEMSQGWFAKRGIKAGTSIAGLKKP